MRKVFFILDKRIDPCSVRCRNNQQDNETCYGHSVCPNVQIDDWPEEAKPNDDNLENDGPQAYCGNDDDGKKIFINLPE